MWQAILAAMLMLQAPGKSLYSQVLVPEMTPAPCEDRYSLLCLPPQWSEAHGGFVVAETWPQGVERYATIARALELALSKKRETPGKHLWRFVVAFAFHESGFRRDVHEGVGHAARGDCDWRGEPGKRSRIPGSCKSHCLGQIMLGPLGSRAKTSEGWSPEELVGLDADSTGRCLSVMARIINGAYQYCAHHGGGPRALCVVKHYAGGSIASTDPRVLSRIKTVNLLYSAPTKLEAEAILALGLGGDE